MPDIVLPYLPADGAAFDTDGLNRDLYEVPAVLPVGTLSLYETTNGQITFANLAPGFTVRKHMIRPGEVGQGWSDGAVKPLDFFQDAWGADESFQFVAGMCETFRTRYAASVALFHWQWFASIWRQRTNTGGVFTAGPRIVFKAYIDENPVNATLRYSPQTVYYDNALTYGGYDYNFGREARLTRQFNLHHAKVTGGSGSAAPLAAGEHTAALGVYVAQNKGTETIDLDGGGLGSLYKQSYQEAQHRVRIFARHVDVVSFL